ncbi:MAG: TonB-dependent receptor [Salibacteraceae bacterium]
MKLLTTIVLIVISMCLEASDIKVRVVTDGDKASEAVAFIDNTDQFFEANESGLIVIADLEPGEHVITIFIEGYASHTQLVEAGHDGEIVVNMEPMGQTLEAVNINESKNSGTGHGYLKYIEVDGLYAAKKNEVIVPSDMAVNQTNNNGRQIFAKVPGINVQETDAGGLQMGVGARGLDPKRTTNFNTRQDGYDIAADALGYPESYYTPPIEAVEQIELVRGAASLQYGTQFGGLLNFKMKRGSENKPIELVSRQTIGSYDFFNSFNSIGGTKGEWNYYAYYQHKEGNGWRPNSFFNANGGYAQVGRTIGENWSVDIAYTHYHYTAKQPGGLTDKMFEDNPNQSVRDRNWFQVNWNVGAITVNGKLSKNLTVNSKTFAVMAERAALGFLGNINRVDTLGKRDLILGEYLNVGNETRFIQRFNIHSNPGALLVGTRLYQGNTRSRQGAATGFDGPDFSFENPSQLEGSDFSFPSQNVSLFSEALIPLSACWYLTPGVRYEYIRTENSGYYLSENRHPLTNEVLNSEQVTSSDVNPRSLLLFGIGTTYRCFDDLEIYGNVSQNYRAINFSDVRVVNDNLLVDSNLTDEHGWTADIGFRGKLFKNALTLDASGFVMMYNNRIGQTQKAITNTSTKLIRTNIADARFVGLEIFEELDILQFFGLKKDWKMTWFNNVALVDARYIAQNEKAFANKRVENVPMLNLKSGLSFTHNRFGAGIQLNHVTDQYTDASNSEFYPDATVGLIPSYTIVDLSAKYAWKRYSIEGSINNLTDEIYFTRRATGYPGPGIIPAQRRMFFFTFGLKL